MTKIIGILNLTLDSFSDGGKYYDRDSAKKHISVMIQEGADVIDLGAESTRSGFTDVDEDIQISTLAPIIDYINSHFEIEISIDTRSSINKSFYNQFKISFGINPKPIYFKPRKDFSIEDELNQIFAKNELTNTDKPKLIESKTIKENQEKKYKS